MRSIRYEEDLPYGIRTANGWMHGAVQRNLCKDLSKYVTHEAGCDKHVAFAVFLYKTSRNDSTRMYQFFAMFGVESFEFDACLGLALRMDEEPQDVAERLAEAHAQLLSASLKIRSNAQRQYYKAVKQTTYTVGDLVILYHVPGLTEEGQKLRVPWLFPYKVVEKLSEVWYIVESVFGGKLRGYM